jgi:peptidoglycan hydrolase-like protein with peptidoglycan-binding domain
MKKTGFIILALAIGVCLWGCSKKESSEELSQEPMSMETLSTMSTTETKAAPEMKPEARLKEAKPAAALEAPAATTVTQAEPKLEPLPPSGPYKPTVSEIQTALTNAGYYSGKVDGKIGPKTKKAIEEFQKANGLQADGKVGPKTWVVLSKHLNAAATEPAKKQAAKKR